MIVTTINIFAYIVIALIHLPSHCKFVFKLAGDVMADDEPMYLLLVTARQWHYIQKNTSGQVWRTFLQNAWNRASSFESGKKHPLFTGEPGMWNNILIRKMGRSIRFNPSDSVKYYSNATTETAAAVAARKSGFPAAA